MPATSPTDASAHGHAAGRATRKNVPEIAAGCPFTATGTVNRPAGPAEVAGGGASRWSCQTTVRPPSTWTQPRRELETSRSPVAVGELAFTHTPLWSILSSGSRSAPSTTRRTPRSALT